MERIAKGIWSQTDYGGASRFDDFCILSYSYQIAIEKVAGLMAARVLVALIGGS